MAPVSLSLVEFVLEAIWHSWNQIVEEQTKTTWPSSLTSFASGNIRLGTHDVVPHSIARINCNTNLIWI